MDTVKDKNNPEKSDSLDFLVAELKQKQKMVDALKESIYGKKSTNTNSKQPV